MIYRVITSGGKKAQLNASSAAHALEEARWLFRGQTIKEVYSGLKEEDVDFINLVDSAARPLEGYIIHEIPDHEPIPESEVRYKKIRTKEIEAQTIPMFNEDTIRRESEAAKAKRDST